MTAHADLGGVVAGHRAVDEHLAHSLGRELGGPPAAPGVDLGVDDAGRPREVVNRPVAGHVLEEAVPHGCGNVRGEDRVFRGQGRGSVAVSRPCADDERVLAGGAPNRVRRGDVAERDEVIGVLARSGLERRRAAAARPWRAKSPQISFWRGSVLLARTSVMTYAAWGDTTVSQRRCHVLREDLLAGRCS